MTTVKKSKPTNSTTSNHSAKTTATKPLVNVKPAAAALPLMTTATINSGKRSPARHDDNDDSDDEVELIIRRPKALVFASADSDEEYQGQNNNKESNDDNDILNEQLDDKTRQAWLNPQAGYYSDDQIEEMQQNEHLPQQQFHDQFYDSYSESESLNSDMASDLMLTDRELTPTPSPERSPSPVRNMNLMNDEQGTEGEYEEGCEQEGEDEIITAEKANAVAADFAAAATAQQSRGSPSHRFSMSTEGQAKRKRPSAVDTSSSNIFEMSNTSAGGLVGSNGMDTDGEDEEEQVKEAYKNKRLKATEGTSSPYVSLPSTANHVHKPQLFSIAPASQSNMHMGISPLQPTGIFGPDKLFTDAPSTQVPLFHQTQQVTMTMASSVMPFGAVADPIFQGATVDSSLPSTTAIIDPTASPPRNQSRPITKKTTNTTIGVDPFFAPQCVFAGMGAAPPKSVTMAYRDRDEQEFWSPTPKKDKEKDSDRFIPVSAFKSPDDIAVGEWLKSPFTKSKNSKKNDASATPSKTGGKSDMMAMTPRLLLSATKGGRSAKTPSTYLAKQFAKIVKLVDVKGKNTQMAHPMNEILMRVFEYVGATRKSQLYPCLFVNKQWHEAASRVMWRHLNLDSLRVVNSIYTRLSGVFQEVRDKMDIPQTGGRSLTKKFQAAQSKPKSASSTAASSPSASPSLSQQQPQQSQQLQSKQEQDTEADPFIDTQPSPVIKRNLRPTPTLFYNRFVESISYHKLEEADIQTPRNYDVSGFFTKLFPNLKSLTLSGATTWLNDDLLRSLTTSNGLGQNLLKLSLTSTNRFSKAALMECLPKFKSLQVLELQAVDSVDDDVLAVIATSLPNLHTISLTRFYTSRQQQRMNRQFPLLGNPPTDAGVFFLLTTLPLLKNVTIGYCENISADAVIAALVEREELCQQEPMRRHNMILAPLSKKLLSVVDEDDVTADEDDEVKEYDVQPCAFQLTPIESLVIGHLTAKDKRVFGSTVTFTADPYNPMVIQPSLLSRYLTNNHSLKSLRFETCHALADKTLEELASLTTPPSVLSKLTLRDCPVAPNAVDRLWSVWGQLESMFYMADATSTPRTYSRY